MSIPATQHFRLRPSSPLTRADVQSPLLRVQAAGRADLALAALQAQEGVLVLERVARVVDALALLEDLVVTEKERLASLYVAG